MDFSLPLIVTVIGALLGIVGMLIVLNLRSIKNSLASIDKRLDGHEERIATIEQDHRDDIRNSVDKEDWVRSEAYTRNKLDRLNVSLNRIEGKLQVVEKLPEVSGAIAREIVKELTRKKGAA